eukprot:1509069-Prymnesium_polylepis.1
MSDSLNKSALTRSRSGSAQGCGRKAFSCCESLEMVRDTTLVSTGSGAMNRPSRLHCRIPGFRLPSELSA